LSTNNFSGSATEEEEALAVEEAEAEVERALGSPAPGSAKSLSLGMAPKSVTLLKKAEESAQKYENTPGVAMESTPFSSTAPLAFSPQFLGLKEGIELVAKSLQYVCREESIMREYMLTEQGLLVRHLDSTLVGLLRYRTEVAHLNNSKSYLTNQIDDLQRKLDTKSSLEEKATVQSRDLENKLTELSGDYALAKDSIKHFDMEKMSLKVMFDKTKADALLLTEKLEESKRENVTLCEQSEKFVSDMLAAQSEAREIVQKLCIVEAERDELKKQFITNAHMPVTSQFTERKYNLPPNSSRVFIPSRSSGSIVPGEPTIETSCGADSPGNGPFSPVSSRYTPRSNLASRMNTAESLSPRPPENDATVVPPGITAFVDSFSLSAGAEPGASVGVSQSPMHKRGGGSNPSLENLSSNSPMVYASTNRVSSNSGSISGVHTSAYKTPLSAKYI